MLNESGRTHTLSPLRLNDWVPIECGKKYFLTVWDVTSAKVQIWNVAVPEANLTGKVTMLPVQRCFSYLPLLLPRWARVSPQFHSVSIRGDCYVKQ